MARHVTGAAARRLGSEWQSRSFLRAGLVEILVATTILGLLAAVVVGGVREVDRRAARAACDESVTATATAAHAYLGGHGVYPHQHSELVAEGYLRPQVSSSYEIVYSSNDPEPGFTVTGHTHRGDSCRTETG